MLACQCCPKKAHGLKTAVRNRPIASALLASSHFEAVRQKHGERNQAQAAQEGAHRKLPPATGNHVELIYGQLQSEAK